MTTESSVLPETGPDARAAAPAILPATRPFYWSVRRELWEYRSIYVAPLVAAGLVLFGSLIAAISFPHDPRLISDIDVAGMSSQLVKPFGFSAMVVIVTSFIVAVFYCLGALYNERRDRSLLFWKSLPVSDLVAVLAKLSVPMVIMPVVTFVVVMAMQLILLFGGVAALMLNGASPAALFTHLPVAQMVLVLAYGLVVMALWYAPIYGWLLLVSAWAKRAPFLWAVLTPLALTVVEHIALRTHYLVAIIGDRLAGGFTHAFGDWSQGPNAPELPQIDLIGFLGTPGLWIGLAVAAAFLAAAVWMRRYREPS
jgi:ABC-2 type transport system permease protein